MDDSQINRALSLLDATLAVSARERIAIVVCGGAALRLSGLVIRTTNDVDVLALRDLATGELRSPAPLPSSLKRAGELVGRELSLPNDWLNNGPSSDEGGIFQLGVPQGLEDRLRLHLTGNFLDVYLIDRLDQIHLKFWASVDQPGSYHYQDLLALKPSEAEIERACKWTLGMDVSEGFRHLAVQLLKVMGFANVASRI